MQFFDFPELLSKLNETHPELCSKDKFMQSESFKNASMSNTTFDRPNLTNDPNISENLCRKPSVSAQRNPHLKRSAVTNPKKAPAKKTKLTKEISSNPPPPVAPVEKDVSDDEALKKKKIRQYIEWARELRGELLKRQEESITN